jgi:hypothetical protein
MIGISTRSFDNKGHIRLKPDLTKSKLGNIARRVKVTSTLDGGVAVEDRGFTKTDMQFSVVFNSVEATNEHVEYLVKNYKELRVAINSDIYWCAPLKLVKGTV